jgi:hypothetical protein
MFPLGIFLFNIYDENGSVIKDLLYTRRNGLEQDEFSGLLRSLRRWRMELIMVAMFVMVPRGVLGGDSLLSVLDSTTRAMEGGGVYNRC